MRRRNGKVWAGTRGQDGREVAADGVIRCAVRWYFRVNLSLCDSEELLLERGGSGHI